MPSTPATNVGVSLWYAQTRFIIALQSFGIALNPHFVMFARNLTAHSSLERLNISEFESDNGPRCPPGPDINPGQATVLPQSIQRSQTDFPAAAHCPAVQ